MKILSSSHHECPHSERYLKGVETHVHSSGPAACSTGSFFSFAAETTMVQEWLQAQHSEHASSSRTGSQEPHSIRQEPKLPLPGEGQGLGGALELQGPLQAHSFQRNTAGVSFLLESLDWNQQLSYYYNWLGSGKTSVAINPLEMGSARKVRIS